MKGGYFGAQKGPRKTNFQFRGLFFRLSVPEAIVAGGAFGLELGEFKFPDEEKRHSIGKSGFSPAFEALRFSEVCDDRGVPRGIVLG